MGGLVALPPLLPGLGQLGAPSAPPRDSRERAPSLPAPDLGPAAGQHHVPAPRGHPARPHRGPHAPLAARRRAVRGAAPRRAWAYMRVRPPASALNPPHPSSPADPRRHPPPSTGTCCPTARTRPPSCGTCARCAAPRPRASCRRRRTRARRLTTAGRRTRVRGVPRGAVQFHFASSCGGRLTSSPPPPSPQPRGTRCGTPTTAASRPTAATACCRRSSAPTSGVCVCVCGCSCVVCLCVFVCVFVCRAGARGPCCLWQRPLPSAAAPACRRAARTPRPSHTPRPPLLPPPRSPAHSTGQRYVYSGSSCGGIFVWDTLTARQVQMQSASAHAAGQAHGPATAAAAPTPLPRPRARLPPRARRRSRPRAATALKLLHSHARARRAPAPLPQVAVLRHHRAIVRDCSWHPSDPELTSVSWDGTCVSWDAVPPGEAPADAAEAALRREAAAYGDRFDGYY